MTRSRLLATAFVVSAICNPRVWPQVPLENEVLANQAIASSQTDARVYQDGMGATHVFWRDLGAPGGTQIRARLFAPDGSEGAEVTLYGLPGGSFLNAVGANRQGEGVLLYDAQLRNWALHFERTGGLVGEAIAVNDPNRFTSGNGDAAVGADGRFVVAMHSSELVPGSSQFIVARVFSSQGTARTDLFQVSDDPTRIQQLPSVASDAAGNFTVFWTSYEGSDTFRTHLRRYDANGVALGPVVDPTPPGGGDQIAWDIAMDPAGNFVIFWGKGNGPWDDVWARRFGPDGQPRGEAFRVNQVQPSAQYFAAADMDSSGNFVVTWESAVQEGRIGEIYARLFRPDGRPASDEFHVNQLSGQFEETLPRVALSDDGVIALTWVNWYTGDGSAEATMLRRYLATCAPDATFLPLRNGRFLACARWETTDGQRGSGVPAIWSDESGGFWFFDDANLELFVKLLDGCGINGHYWLYVSGLTDVGVDLAVLDTWTGAVRSYARPRGIPFVAIQDVDAFATCNATPNPTAIQRFAHLPRVAPGDGPMCR